MANESRVYRLPAGMPYSVPIPPSPFLQSSNPTRCRETKRMETPSTLFCWPRYRRLSCWRCCLYSYTGKSGRHRITRQPEEMIHPNRTAEIPKTDSTCKGENEDVSKKEFAGAAAVLMHGGRNTDRRQCLLRGNMCRKSPRWSGYGTR